MADNPQSSNDGQITFNVEDLSRRKIDVTMSSTETVSVLRDKLAAALSRDIFADSSRLLYSGSIMENDKTLRTYGIKRKDTIFILKSATSNQQSDQISNISTSTSTLFSTPITSDTTNQSFANLTDTVPDIMCAPDHLQDVDAAFQNPCLINTRLLFDPMLGNFQTQPPLKLLLTAQLPDDEIMMAPESLSSSGCEGIGAFLTPVFDAENVHEQRKQSTSVTCLSPPALAGIQMREGIPEVQCPMQDLDKLHLGSRTRNVTLRNCAS
ncbi:hypothetical protein FBULB1_5920 [Fusarium bulbicola]|nr:hypothetical protein FBULB1_5920 [Fusarium bulbicola]